MKTVYETPTLSVSECRVKDDFLVSANVPTTSTTFQYDSNEGWSPIKPPKT